MTKSGVRALDAMTEFIFDKTGHYPIKAGLTGASKRALTSWLVAAVDFERVVFIAPDAVFNCIFLYRIAARG